jgi:hypothetical protein
MVEHLIGQPVGLKTVGLKTVEYRHHLAIPQLGFQTDPDGSVDRRRLICQHAQLRHRP